MYRTWPTTNTKQFNLIKYVFAGLVQSKVETVSGQEKMAEMWTGNSCHDKDVRYHCQKKIITDEPGLNACSTRLAKINDCDR